MSIERLDIIIQKTLPLVYDDSLSYLEFLAKVVAKVNEAIDELNIYLNQDLRSYVEQKLIAWKNDGTLDTLIADAVLNIGDRQYTEQNYVTDMETVTASIDALDVGVAAHLADISKNQKGSSFILSQGDITDFISGHGRKVVLTGDSLSFNYQDFDAGNVSNTADMNYAGLMSWAHILRDTIKRNDFGFVSAEDLNIIVSSSLETRRYNLSEQKYVMPFNNKNVLITLKADNINSAVKIKYKHNNPLNKAVLHMSKTNSNLACLFDVYVDGVLKAQNVDNGGNPNRYFGSEMFEVSVDCLGDNLIHTIELKNFRTSVTRPGNVDGVYGILLSAVGTKKTDVYLTGEGGVKSEWLSANIQSRILNYNPDVVCLIAGANDIYHEVGVNVYKANMTSIVESIYANNANTKILLLTSPSMSHPNTPDSETIKYNDALKEIAITYNCYFIDLLKLFSRISPSLWRFDNVHLSKLGSAILGKNVIDLLMPNHMVDAKYFDTTYQVPYNTYKRVNLLAMENSWVNMISEGFYPLQWVREGRIVHIFGSIKSGLTTLGTRIAALPEEIKPSKYHFIGAMSIENNAQNPCMLSITNGNLNVSYGVTNTQLMVDITYVLD